MDGFAVISREEHQAANGMHRLLRSIIPPEAVKGSVGDIGYTCIKVPEYLERRKLRQAMSMANKITRVVVSKDYNVNYSRLCYYSMLIRALDFYCISLGCDLRLHEVVIGDAATGEGVAAFKLLCPIARRILLVTDNKKRLEGIAEKAMIDYGISAAVIENPIKAAERSDAIILASDNDRYSHLLIKDRPTLIMRFPRLPISGKWFDTAGLGFMGKEGTEEVAVQGYLSYLKKDRIWQAAEKEGFTIDAIMQQGRIILNRQL